MSFLRRQTRRIREIEKIRDSKWKKGAATIGATVALSHVAMLNTQKVAHAASAQQSFIQKIATYAQELAGKNDLYASVMIAQAILESSWGSSVLASAPNYNLFGIKGTYQGQSVNIPTLEDNGKGKYYQVKDNFRKYPSYYESLQDYVNLLKSPFRNGNYFYSGAWKSNTSSYREATRYLTGRYATDTAYASKLNRIIESYGLTQYDTGRTVKSVLRTQSVTQSASTLTTLAVNGQYIVQRGDSLWSIAVKNGMNVATLKAVNQLTSDHIVEGQSLKLIVENKPTVTPVVKPTVTLVQPTVSSQPVVPVTPVATVQEKKQSVGVQYTVQSGDTLYHIARQYGMSVAELKSNNQLTSDLIRVGQVLQVTGTGNTPSAPVVTQTVSTTAPQVKAVTPVTSTVAVQEKKQSVGVQYTVQSGDTLYHIARQYGMSVAELKSDNQLTSDLIRVGQVLQVTGSGNTPSAPVVTQTVSTTTPQVKAVTPVATVQEKKQSVGGQYTVQSGDTLYRIARQYGMSVAELKSNNQLTSDLIRVGQVLQVTGSGNTPSVPVVIQTVSTTAPQVKVVTPVVQHVETKGDYTVKAGDTLYRIANQYSMSVDVLKALNSLSSDLIRVGQVLKVSQTTPQPVQATPSTALSSEIYTVQKGDTLYRIANAHKISVDQLKVLNQLSSNIIQIGQILQVK